LCTELDVEIDDSPDSEGSKIIADGVVSYDTHTASRSHSARRTGSSSAA